MALLFAFPSLINVSSMLFLLVYMYAILGMQLFSFVRHQRCATSPTRLFAKSICMYYTPTLRKHMYAPADCRCNNSRCRVWCVYRTLAGSRNFESFGNALLLLLQCLTGDNWSALMDDCGLTQPMCNPEAGDCGSWLAIPFFISFQVTSYY